MPHTQRSNVTDSRDQRHPALSLNSFDASLCACEGFSVVGPRGLVGVVCDLEYGSQMEMPDHLIVEGTEPRRRLIVIDSCDVIAVDAPGRTILTNRIAYDPCNVVPVAPDWGAMRAAGPA
jgi:hypothetical protein